MPRVAVKDHATPETRAKGARAANAAKARKKQERIAQHEERFESLADKAINRLERLLDSEDDGVAVRAASQVLDRYLGKPSQRHEHEGHVELGVDIEEARAKLADALRSQR